MIFFELNSQMTNDFTGIAEFLAVVETGSFSAAAERLGLTASAMSKSISRLEKRLNTQLFHRSTRRITLTSEGEVWLNACRRMSEELAQAQWLLSNEQQQPIGQVRIDLPTTYGRVYALPKLLDLAAQYPDLKMNIAFQDRLVDMVAEGVDIAIRFGKLGDLSDVIARQIGDYQNQICASPDYLARFGVPKLPQDLAHHRCIVAWRNTKSDTWKMLGENGERAEIPIFAQHELNDGDARLQAALRGAGLVQLPDWLIAPFVARGELVQVLAEFAEPPSPIFVLWQKKLHLQPKVRVVVDCFQAA